MRMDNKGFTLVETLIAFTIMAIVSTVVVGFIGVSAELYRQVSSDVSRQHSSQITMNQLYEFIVDCSDLHKEGENELYVVEQTGSDPDTYVVHIFRQGGEELLYSSGTCTRIDELDGSYSYEYIAANLIVENSPMARNLKSSGGWQVEIASTGSRVDTVQLTLILSQTGSDYETTQTIAPRNAVYEVVVELKTTT